MSQASGNKAKTADQVASPVGKAKEGVTLAQFFPGTVSTARSVS